MQRIGRSLLQEEHILPRVRHRNGKVADRDLRRLRRVVGHGDGQLVKPVRKARPHLLIDPRSIAACRRDLRRIGEVRRDPFGILPKAVVRKRQFTRQICRDAVGRHRPVAIAERLQHGRNEVVRVATDCRIAPREAVCIGRRQLIGE